MKIALIGYGKMGKIIEKIAIDRGHTIVLKIDKENAATVTDEQLKEADVAIEFTMPQSAVTNMEWCFRNRVPVVVGTTGWTQQLDEVKKMCKSNKGALFFASNFSLGVNLFFRLNERLAELMKPYPEYRAVLEEIHHVHKLDAPSGTALTLAEGVLGKMDRTKSWKSYLENCPPATPADELPVVSKRTGEVPGTHTVTYTSSVDRISITHEAFSREGFALGAVIAAEWMPGKKGVFGMDDLLGE
jgi:4-hydroxy-tetrahydrodipicolinate reductase